MFTLAEDNIVWWRVDMPGRNEDGELDTAPVRLQLRIYTRAELRERKSKRMTDSINPLSEALNRMMQAQDPAQLSAATQGLEERVNDLNETAEAEEAEVHERVLGWRAEDLGGLEFSPEIRDRLLADDLRFNAIRQALEDASRGVRSKNSLPGPAGKPAPVQAGKTEKNNSGTKTGSTPE